jgi:RNA polymerase sigma factor (sigma-70 family)
LNYESLVELAKRGDKDSFIQLIKDCEDTMYRVSRSILKNDFDCSDAIQETILNAYSGIQTLKNPKYFKTWLVRILINECNRMLKSRKNIISIAKWTEPIEKIEIHKDLGVDEAIHSLAEKFRIIVTLYYLEEFSTKEISNLLQIPEGTVKSRLNRARLKLEKLLKKQEEGSFCGGNE